LTLHLDQILNPKHKLLKHGSDLRCASDMHIRTASQKSTVKQGSVEVLVGKGSLYSKYLV